MTSVSVIIPAYNSGRYIHLPLESLKSQTFQDMEVIIINDGSTDNTPEVVENILSDVSFRWKIIDQENMGASAARNRGLKIARGRYVFFLDSDDYIHNTFIERLYRVAQEHDYDAVFSGINWVSPNGKILKVFRVSKCNPSCSTSGKMVAKLLLNRDVVITSENIIYKRIFLKKHRIQFNPHHKQFIGDIFEFVMKVLYNSDNIGCVPDPLVFYTVRPGSASRRYTVEDLSLHLDNIIRAYTNVWMYITRANNGDNTELSNLLEKYIGTRMVDIIFLMYALGNSHEAEIYKRNKFKFIKRVSHDNAKKLIVKMSVIYFPKLIPLTYRAHKIFRM